MYFSDINKRFTDIVAEYIGNGYTINAATMFDIEEEIAKVDLTNGNEIIRIQLRPEYSQSDMVEFVSLEVGKCPIDILPNYHSNLYFIRRSSLEILECEQFYKVGEKRDGRVFYGDYDHARYAAYVRIQRQYRYETEGQSMDLTEKRIEIVKRLLKRKFPYSQIKECDIALVKRSGGGYDILYGSRTYRIINGVGQELYDPFRPRWMN
jgi:hypothetical protein